MATGSLHIRLRPIRLAFVVPPYDKGALLEAIKINSFLWGGSYNPIIPNYKRLPRSWSEGPSADETAKIVLSGYLDAFDPDYIVLVGKSVQPHFDIGRRKEISSSEILQDAEQDHTPCYGIGLFELLHEYIIKEARFVTYNKLDACAFDFSKDGELFLSSVFGQLPPGLDSVFREQFGPQLHLNSHQCSLANYASFLNRERLFLRRATEFHIDRQNRPVQTNDCILFMDASNPLDITDYWNLRAAGRTVIPIPKQSAKLDATEALVRDFIEENFGPYRHNARIFHDTKIIKSRSISREEFDDYLRRLASQFPPTAAASKFEPQQSYPRIWDEWTRDRDMAKCCDLESKAKEIDIPDLGDRVGFRTLDPSFAFRISSNFKPRFANEIELRSYGQEDLTAEVLPEGGQELARAFRIIGTHEWRFSKKGLVYLCKHVNWSTTLSPPKSEDLFKIWLAASGWTAELSQAGRTAQQILKQLGGVWNISTLAHEEIIKLLGDMNESKGMIRPMFELLRQAKTAQKSRIESIMLRIEQLLGSNDERGVLAKDTLVARMSRAAGTSAPQNSRISLLRSLTEIDALRLGTTIQCPVCSRSSWYSLSDLSYELRCPKCAEKYEVPSHDPNSLKWSYKTFGAFSLPGQADGAYSVLLCLRFFSRILDSATTPILSFVARKPGVELEADLALLLRESRFSPSRTEAAFCECKTYGIFEARDVDRMATIADHFTGAFLVFATLRQSLEPNEKRRLRVLANKGRRYWKAERPYNPIMVLTRNELFAEFNVRSTWDELGGKHKAISQQLRGYNELIAIADATQQLYLDLPPWHQWLHERWQRRRAKALRMLTSPQQPSA